MYIKCWCLIAKKCWKLIAIFCWKVLAVYTRASVVNLAEENNALIHIGRCVRIDVQKLDKALDKISEGSENYGADCLL